jgi:hypothetical protein
VQGYTQSVTGRSTPECHRLAYTTGPAGSPVTGDRGQTRLRMTAVEEVCCLEALEAGRDDVEPKLRRILAARVGWPVVASSFRAAPPLQPTVVVVAHRRAYSGPPPLPVAALFSTSSRAPTKTRIQSCNAGRPHADEHAAHHVSRGPKPHTRHAAARNHRAPSIALRYGNWRACWACSFSYPQ